MYNSSTVSMIWRIVRPLNEADYSAYVSVFRRRDKIDSVVNNCGITFDFDPSIELALDEFVEACRSANIPLLTAVFPGVRRFKRNRLDWRRVSDCVSSLECDWLDPSASRKNYLNKKRSHDPAHLNYELIEFSKEIAAYLGGKCVNGNAACRNGSFHSKIRRLIRGRLVA